MFEIAKNSLIRNKIKEITIEKMVKKMELDNSENFERILISNYFKFRI